MLQLLFGIAVTGFGVAVLFDMGHIRTDARWWGPPSISFGRRADAAGLFVAAVLLTSGLVSTASAVYRLAR